MPNDKGFTLIESLVASSIIFMIIITIIPIITLINDERKILSDRRMISNQLHDKLQPYLWETIGSIPINYTKKINYIDVNFRFTNEDQLIKGCVEWDNVKKRKEEFCIYGSRQ